MDSGLSSASEEFCWGDDSTERSSTHLEEEPVSNDVEINENDIFQERLKDIACRSQRLLSILNNNYAEGTTKTPVSGINKLKHKIEREVLNATHCLSMLNEMSQISNTSDCDVNEENSMEWSRCVAKAKLISQCSGITTLEMCVALLLSEPEVSSVCAPFSSCHTLTDISQSRLQTSTKNRSVEVDIVSCGGRRWIKVRGARHRDEGDKSDEHQLRQWIEGLNNAARSRYVPFQENPHIYIVFSTPPPTRLCSLLEAEKCPYSVLSPEGCKRMLNSDLHPPFLPPLVLKPQFICWDTTALVAFCSESCYTSFNWKREERLTALESFKVLKEQQRRELSDFSDRERAVHDFIHPYLERYTTEITLEELKATIRRQICQSMVRSCEVLSELPQEDSCCYLPDLTWLRDILEAKLYYLPADRSHYWDDTKWLMNSTFVSRTGDATPLIHATRIGNEDGSKVVRNWVMADISYTEFKWMIETIAGWNECHRAWELLQHCVVVSTGFLEKTITAFRSTSFEPILSNEQPHCNSKEPSCRACVSVPYPNSVGWYNSKTNSISLRNKVVFGLGDALHAITLTSNKQVWSKMLDKGVTLSVALHPSRALTELKMSKQPRREGEKVPPAFSWTLDTK